MAVTAEDRVIAEVKRFCHVGLDETALLGGVAETLRRVIPFDAYCASTTDPASGLMTRTVAEEMGGEKEAAVYLEHVYFEQDVDETLKAAREGRSVALLSKLTGGELERSTSYREFLRPLGLAHTMGGVFAADGRIWGTLDLAREGGRSDFDPSEAALLRHLAPHVSAGLKLAALRSQAPPETAGDGVPGVLVLDRRGKILHHTASAERWLRDLGDLGPGWREGVGPASGGVDGGERATKDPQARDGTGPEQQRPPSPRPVPFRAVVDVSGRAQRATNGRRDRDDDRHRAGRTSRSRLAEHSRVRPESPRTGGRGPRGTRGFHEGDLADSLHLRVHRPGAPLQRLRKGRRAEPKGTRKALLLRCHVLLIGSERRRNALAAKHSEGRFTDGRSWNRSPGLETSMSTCASLCRAR